MLYKGNDIVCDYDDLKIIGNDEDTFFSVGYYGAGGAWVDLYNTDNLEDAEENFEQIFEALYNDEQEFLAANPEFTEINPEWLAANPEDRELY